MSFIDNARVFLTDQGRLRNNKKCNVMVETVRFLLDNAIGIENAVSTNNIIKHLESQGFRIKKEDWQINVLGPLRDHGIFIGSKRGGRAAGMYIIATKEDALQTHAAIYDRIHIERKRLFKLEDLMDEMHWEYE